LVNKSKKPKKSQRKKARKIVLKLYEPIVEVDRHGFKHKVPVIVLACCWKEAYAKAVETLQKTKFWQKSGLRPTEEFR